MRLFIYTDGASKGNPGPSGYGFASFYQKPINKQVATESIAHAQVGNFRLNGTNNQQEVSAIYMAMRYVEQYYLGYNFEVEIISDSALCVNTYNKWLDGWMKSGDIKYKANNAIWKAIYELKTKLQDIYGIRFIFTHIKGHAGELGNEISDRLANYTVYNQIVTSRKLTMHEYTNILNSI